MRADYFLQFLTISATAQSALASRYVTLYGEGRRLIVDITTSFYAAPLPQNRE